jgi:hypothetical protein
LLTDGVTVPVAKAPVSTALVVKSVTGETAMQDVQERKGGDTRERVLDAAESAVLEKGFAPRSRS